MTSCEVWLARDFLARAGRPLEVPACDHPAEDCPPHETEEPTCES